MHEGPFKRVLAQKCKKRYLTMNAAVTDVGKTLLSNPMWAIKGSAGENSFCH